MAITGFKPTKIGALRRAGELPTTKAGPSVQAGRPFSRDGILAYQLECIVRAHTLDARMAAE
jgi:hypothetical protein